MDVGNFFITILYGFLGGFVLNFMPCVLPVISLKILSIVKLGSVSKYRANLVAICAGILASFLLLAFCLVAIKASGQYAGLGFTFQQPIFVIIFALLTVVFASAISHNITIDIPHQLKTMLHLNSNESSLLGSFLSGAFATLLATPCTAPFLGTTVAYALTLNYAQIIAIFSSIALGMSLPFILVMISPRLLNLLPKPGPWLVKFKALVQVMLYATTLWLIWIILGELGTKSAIALLVAAVILKFALDSNLRDRVLKNCLTAFAIIIAFALPIALEDLSKVGKWHEFSAKEIDVYVDQGYTVFVDITSDWCLTCQYNKKFVLDTQNIKDFFTENNVILLRGDFTKNHKEIGDFLDKYKRSGIPFNVVFSNLHPAGLILSPILTQKEVMDVIKAARTT